MVDFVGVSRDMVKEAWPTVEPLIQKPLDKTGAHIYYSTDDIKTALLAMNMQLWIAVVDGVVVAAFISEILKYPQRKVLDVPLVGGSMMNEWLPAAWKTLKEYGRAHDCKGIRGFGRKGWTQVLEEKPKFSVSWDVDL